MRKFFPVLIILIILSGFALFIANVVHHSALTLLQPQGSIGLQERNLMFLAVGIMLLLALPVLGSLYYVAWKYRAGNTKAKYNPAWTGSTFLKLAWWALPGSLVIVFSFIIWYGAHALDPYKPITSPVKPITIEVVALQWKWLFIYPEQHIATVNFIQFPVHTPVSFQLTADAPMNSFWIPSLGGQIYAMSAMETHLQLMANNIGDYPGEEAEINGAGYSDMRFIARASTQADFDKWIQQVKHSSQILDFPTYSKLAQPSEDAPVTYYASVDNNLYNTIIMKSMTPSSRAPTGY